MTPADPAWSAADGPQSPSSPQLGSALQAARLPDPWSAHSGPREGRCRREPPPPEPATGPECRWPEPPEHHAPSLCSASVLPEGIDSGAASASSPSAEPGAGRGGESTTAAGPLPPRSGSCGSSYPPASSGSPAILAAPGPGGAPSSAFSQQVRRSFGRRAGDYDRLARLQMAVDHRLARLVRALPLPAGPCADLGAGSGLLSRALVAQHPQLRRQPPLQLDLCPELLARNPLSEAGPESPAASSLVWDLNDGLPPQLQGAALLASSFALQWLEQPARQLAHWIRQLRPEGWLVLAVPTAGSFPQWRQAAQRASVPCTALELPPAAALLQAARREGLALEHSACLRYSRPAMGGLPALRHLQQLGAGTSRRAPLAPADLRRLLLHWPPHSPLTWEVLLLIGQRRR